MKKRYSFPAVPLFLIILVLTVLLIEFRQQRSHERQVELLSVSSREQQGIERTALPFQAAHTPEVSPPLQTVALEEDRSVSGHLKLNINTASSLELQQLPGIGPVRAQAIIEYREINGPFKTVDELINISGIGEKTLQKIKNQLEL